jgi:hypothetical protein
MDYFMQYCFLYIIVADGYSKIEVLDGAGIQIIMVDKIKFCGVLGCWIARMIPGPKKLAVECHAQNPWHSPPHDKSLFLAVVSCPLEERNGHWRRYSIHTLHHFVSMLPLVFLGKIVVAGIDSKKDFMHLTRKHTQYSNHILT